MKQSVFVHVIYILHIDAKKVLMLKCLLETYACDKQRSCDQYDYDLVSFDKTKQIKLFCYNHNSIQTKNYSCRISM